MAMLIYIIWGYIQGFKTLQKGQGMDHRNQNSIYLW